MTQPCSCVRLSGFVLAAWAVLAATVLGQARKWDNGQPLNDSWHAPLNWDPNGVPDSDDLVEIRVPNTVVRLNAETAFVDSVEISDGADLFTNGHTLQVNDGLGTAPLRLSAASGSSRLVVEIGGDDAGKAADIDIGNINAGGQFDMRGGLIHIDNQLIVNGGTLVGMGALQFNRTSGEALRLDGDVTADNGKLSFLSSGATLDLDGSNGTNTIRVEGDAQLDVDALLSDSFSGLLDIRNGGDVDFKQNWAANGDIKIDNSSATQVVTIQGGQFTLQGTMDLMDGITNITAPVVFAGATITLDNPSTFAVSLNLLDDVTFSGAVNISQVAALSSAQLVIGNSVVSDSLTITGNTTISVEEVNLDNVSTVIAAGAALNVTNSDLAQVSGDGVDGLIQVNGGTLTINAAWKTEGGLFVNSGGVVNGGRVNVAGGLFAGNATFNADVRLDDPSSSFFASNTVIFNGETAYGSTEISGATAVIVQNGDASTSFATVPIIDVEQLQIAGGAGANTTFTVSERLTTNEATIAQGAGSTGLVNIAGGLDSASWTVRGSLYVGGSDTTQAGGGTLRVNKTGTQNNLKVDEVLRVWGTGSLEVLDGQMEVGSLLMSAGSDFTFARGEIRIDAGHAAFSQSSLQYGGTNETDQPTFVFQNGTDAQVEALWVIGDVAGTFGVTTVTGVNVADFPQPMRSTLRSSGTSASADLLVGNIGRGTLDVNDGGLADFHSEVVLGSQTGSVGVGFVSGVSQGFRSTIRADGNAASSITVGNNGTGDLSISDGALVETINFTLGRSGNGSGTLTIGGSSGGFDAELRVTDSVAVGGTTTTLGGVASLNVFDGGLATIGNLLRVHSGSVLRVNGGKLLSTNLDQGGTLDFNGGHVEIRGGDGAFGGALAFEGPSQANTPTFEITDGAIVSLTSLWHIGAAANEFGATIVRGTNADGSRRSTLRSTGGGVGSDLYVGRFGHGELLVEDGGLVDFIDDFELARDGADASGVATIRGVANAQGTLIRSEADVTGSGDGSALNIGRLGYGELNIEGGALVRASGAVSVGAGAGSSATLYIGGASQGFSAELYAPKSPIVVGQAGGASIDATLQIEDDGLLIGDSLVIRSGGEAVILGGTVQVDTLDLTDGGSLELKAGNMTTTHVAVGNGATFDGLTGGRVDVVAGSFAYTSPTLQISAAASGNSAPSLRLQSGAVASIPAIDVVVGDSGPGTMEISGGSAVSSATLEIAAASAADGSHVALTGNGTSWVTGATFVGGDATGAGGDAHLRLEDGALFVADSQIKVWDEGRLWIKNAKVRMGSGPVVNDDNTLVVNTGGALDFSAGGRVLLGPDDHADVEAGHFEILSGSTLRLAGGNVSGVAVDNSGTVSGIGVVNGDLNNSSVVAPGESAGQITLNGNYAQDSLGSLVIEIGGDAPGAEFDLLSVSGAANLAGLLDVALINGFTPDADDSFVVLAADAIIDNGLTLAGPAAGMFNLLVNSNQVVLQVAANLPGDFDNDNDVDGADFLAIQRSNPSLIADWEANFGLNATTRTSTQAIPEPGTLVIAAACGVAPMLRRRGDDLGKSQ